MSHSKFGSGDRMDEWSRKIQDIMDEMRNRMFFDFRCTGTWQPSVNVYESRSAFHVCVELAGLEGPTVNVECLDDQHIRISGQRPQPRTPDLDAPFSVEMMEIDEGPFSREIDLPHPILTHRLESAYDRGFLWIILPKARTT